MTPAFKVLVETVDYDGSQLASLFAYRTAGLLGDSVVAFRGACRVTVESMVDVEDLCAGNRIESPSMVHFIAEQFGAALELTVWRQRVFARLARDLLAERSGAAVRAAGDDLFIGSRKASISVATVSPVSGLFHFALNIETAGVPVPAIGLRELGVEWRPFAETLMERWVSEVEDVRQAAAKVRWVR